jgi:hypothetical protein
VLLAPEAERAVAAAPRLHVDAGAVGKQERWLLVDYGDQAAVAQGIACDADWRSTGFAGRPG